MGRIKKTDNDLVKEAKDQLQFLINACKNYDQGSEVEFKLIALHLRKLLHDKGQSISVLTQLCRIFEKDRDSLRFYDTATPYDPKNLDYFSGLIGLYGPIKGEGLTFLRIPKFRFSTALARSDQKTVDFSKWWNEIVIFNSLDADFSFTRKRLVLTIADQDGGAHVDSGLDAAYYILSREERLSNKDKITFSFNGKQFPVKDIYNSVRQIAEEVLMSFYSNFKNQLKINKKSK